MINRLALWHVLIYILAIFCASPAMADRVDITFSPVFKDVAPGEISTIFQDDEGFLWFAGRYSLLRYNAYELKEIHVSAKDLGRENVRSPRFTKRIIQDSDGIIWLASHDGLFVFNKQTENVEKVRPKTDKDEPLFSEDIHDVAELNSAKILIGVNGGFAILDRANRTVDRRFLDNYFANKKQDSVVRFLIENERRIWMGSHTGLLLYDLETDKIQHFLPDPEHPESRIDNEITQLEIDSEGRIWAGTRTSGFYIFDAETEAFTRFRKGYDNSVGLGEDAIWDIMRDREGVMWIAHDQRGFSRYHAKQKRFYNYFYLPTEAGGLVQNNVRSFYEDRNGDLWVGHYPSGVSFHDRSSQAIRIYRHDYNNEQALSDSNIFGVEEDVDGNLWVAIGNGVVYMDGQTNLFKRYRNTNGKYGPNGTLSNYIDSQGQVWVGTWSDGYSKYNPATDRFDSMPVNARLADAEERISTVLPDATVWTFCETSDGAFWIGTHTAGLVRYDAEINEFTKFQHDGRDNSTLSNNIVWSCLEDSKGRFWVGTAYGVNIMNRESKTFTRFAPDRNADNRLQSGAILAIHEDSEGRIWFGTEDGLHLFQEETNDFRVFNENSGLINNGIRAITEDHLGFMWLGTNKGLVRFNPATFEVKNYTEHAGKKISGVNTGAAMTRHNGEVVFGSVDGLIIVDVEQLTTNTNPPPVVLTDFKIFTKSVPIGGEDALLNKVVNQMDTITLDHTKRMFSFEFAALNYREAEKNKYAYKLEGFDREWREIGGQREAQYTNLSPGNYVFRVRASNNDGVWNRMGSSITIQQLPPPWKTWWAYLIYSLLIAAGVMNLFYSQKRKRQMVEAQNRTLEIKVAERTKDLADKNRDIQLLLSNMRQGLFTIEESGRVHQEYSRFLESIFETEDIAGAQAIELMFGRALINEDTLDQIESSLDTIIGMDQMNYEFNSHLLIREYQVRINGAVKVLSVDWNPIITGDTVTKIMVSVRDITDLKTLKKEADIQKRELEIIGQLLAVNVQSYEAFHESSEQLLKECKTWLLGSNGSVEQIVADLFRNVHTIKGNSRTHGFSYIADAAHTAESYYATLRENPASWSRDKGVEDLELLIRTIEEYDTVYRTVLGRQKIQTPAGDGVWISKNVLDDIRESIAKLKDIDDSAYFKAHSLICRSMAAPLEEVLSRNIESLPSIAGELGKEPPSVKIFDRDILVKQDAQYLLNNVFTHLFRNAIDHGIETSAERKLKNKHSNGTIEVTVHDQGDTVEISIEDDGRGLDLSKLFRKGLKDGKWVAGDSVSMRAISEMIFETGVSTRENVTNVSGRGVGMDAVKEFLRKAGGDIKLNLNGYESVYRPDGEVQNIEFNASILLPKKMFIVEARPPT